MLDLDTHILLYAVTDRLTASETKMLRGRQWSISAIVLWEISKQSTRLDIRGDPADDLIAATSVVHNVPLATRDRTIRRSQTVPLAR